jgi:hypothetical protein
MLRITLILLFLMSTQVFGETIKIGVGKTYCKGFDIPSWGVGKYETGTNLEFRLENSTQAVLAAATFYSETGRHYSEQKYSFSAGRQGKASPVPESLWQSGKVVKRYDHRGSSWPVSSGAAASYAGRTYPRTGKYWGNLAVGPGGMVAISSWTGKFPSDDGLLFLPLWALPFILPSLIIDANRPQHGFDEIYDVASGQKLASIATKSRGTGSLGSSYWLNSGQFVAEAGSMKHLVICDFGRKPL